MGFHRLDALLSNWHVDGNERIQLDSVCSQKEVRALAQRFTVSIGEVIQRLFLDHRLAVWASTFRSSEPMAVLWRVACSVQMALVSRLQKRSLKGHNDLGRMLIYSFFMDKLHYMLGVLPFFLCLGLSTYVMSWVTPEGEAQTSASSPSS